MVLLDWVCRWRKQQADSPPLRVVHVNHALHPNADQWAAECGTLCAQYNVSFECHSVQVDTRSGIGLEAAARHARYTVFERLLGPNDVLLLGHHLDDQVETLLYRLLRGAGPKGLSGIPTSRQLGRGRLLRPMLTISRSTITCWATENGLSFIDDPSNADQTLDRNYLRHVVLPAVEQRWPNYRKTLARAISLQGAAIRMIEAQPQLSVQGPFGEPGLSLKAGETQRDLSQRLYHWLVADGYSSPGLRRLSEYARQCLQASPESTPELVLDGARLYRWRQVIYRFEEQADNVTPLNRVVVGHDLATPLGTLCWDRQTGGLPEGLELRTRARLPGEKMALRGGRTRPFKHLCQAAGVPPWWRDKLLVLCRGDTPVAVTGLGLLRGGNHLFCGEDCVGFSPRWRPNCYADSIE